MSAFNTVTFQSACPNCRNQQTFNAQFKYGDTWQHSYKIGDTIKWKGNEIGIKTAKVVRVEAIGGPCSKCRLDNLEFDLIVRAGILESVVPVGVNRKTSFADGFEILEP